MKITVNYPNGTLAKWDAIGQVFVLMVVGDVKVVWVVLVVEELMEEAVVGVEVAQLMEEIKDAVLGVAAKVEKNELLIVVVAVVVVVLGVVVLVKVEEWWDVVVFWRESLDDAMYCRFVPS